MSDKTDSTKDSLDTINRNEDEETFTWSTPFANQTSLDEISIDFDQTNTSESMVHFGDDETLNETPMPSSEPLEPQIPAASDPSFEPNIEPNIAEVRQEDTEPTPFNDGQSRMPIILSIIAILISAAAIILHYLAPAPSGQQQENSLITEMAEREQEQQVTIQELNRRLRLLEAQQESLSGAVQIHDKRIDAAFDKAIEEKADDVAVKPAPSSPSAVGWAVNLLSMDDKAAAEKETERLKGLGIPAEISPFYIDKVLKYRVRISGFPDKKSAESYRERLASEFGIKESWVYKP